MMNSKVKAAVLDFMCSGSIFNNDGTINHDAYAAECRLFGEHFKNMSKAEMAEYMGFVEWLRDSGLDKSDLLVKELYELYQGNLV